MGGMSLNTEGVKGLGCSEESELEPVLNACRGRLKTRALREMWSEKSFMTWKKGDSPVETSPHHRFPTAFASLFERPQSDELKRRLNLKFVFVHDLEASQRPVARPLRTLQETVSLSATVAMAYQTITGENEISTARFP